MKAKRIIKSGLALLLPMQLVLMSCVTALAAPEWPSDTGVLADIGIAVDADSGAVLFGQGIHELTPPASITKLLTALVVVENSSMDDMVTFPMTQSIMWSQEAAIRKTLPKATSFPSRTACTCCCSSPATRLPTPWQSMWLEAVTPCRYDERKGKGAGMHRRHTFRQPSGLNDDTQVVSAYDMAIIAQAAFNNSNVLEISSTKSYKLAPTQNNPSGATCANEHRLIITEDETNELYCPEAKAGKTGYTSLAGNTLVTYGEKDGRRIISVVLKGQPSPNYFLDGKNLLQFGFQNFQNVSIPDNETKYITDSDPVSINGTDYQPDELELEPGTVITLPKDASFQDASMELVTELPDNRPERAAALLQYTYNDRKIGQAYLLIKEGSLPASGEEANGASPEGDSDHGSENSDQNSGKKEGGFSLPALSLPLIGICLLVFAIILLSAYTLYAKKKEAEELRRRHERRMQRLREENYTEKEFYELLGREKERLAGKRSQKRPAKSRPNKAGKKVRSSKKIRTEDESLDEGFENLDDLFFEDLDSSEESKQNNFDI